MMSAILLTVLYLGVYLHTATADLDNAYCPCHIYVGGADFQIADCESRNLTAIPACVPNTTQFLYFISNHLLYSPRQFQRFENILYLSLLDNPEFAAQIDSFHFLHSLVVLDLRYTDLTYLSGETFRDQSNLLELRLAGEVGQLNVSQTLFDHLGNLRRLALSAKDELELPNMSFVRLRSLWELDLSKTSVLVLHNDTFSGLSALTFLDLRNTLLTTHLPDIVFKPLVSLEELHIEGICSLVEPAFDCRTIDKRLEHVPSLKRLYIDKSLISNLGRGFLSLKNLEELYLVDSVINEACGIRRLTPETFRNLRHSPLTKLVLDNCNINILSPRWFQYLTELKEILLSITSTSYSYFWDFFSKGLENLRLNIVGLSLSTNHAIYLPMPFFVHDGFNATKLTSLELTGTMFNSVNDDTLTKLPKSLNHLNLTDNYIIHFGVENLKYLENLETLDLSNQVDFKRASFNKNGHHAMELSQRNESRRQDFSSLFRKKSDNTCQIDQLQVKLQTYFNSTRTKCLSLPHRLKVLNLSKSRLLCNMVPAFCDSNNSLAMLDASLQRDKSCFETLSFWFALKNLGKLEELNLNGNWVSEIPQGAFTGLSRLRKLTLVDNKLLELAFEVKDLVSLENLDLSVNSIQYASISFTSQIEDVAWKTNLTLNLNNNPLVCNCEQIDFVAWLIVTHVIWNKNKLNCTFEDGTRMSLVNSSYMHHNLKYKCTMLEVTIGCTVTFWGLNIVLGGLAYIWHKRQKLRYLVSFGRRTLNPYHPIEDNEIQMEYDVYISYEGDFNVTRDMTLRDFVIYTILPGLEQRGIKVKIREELEPGRNLYEIITHTVRRSKKVVVFLTNGFCQDMWNVFEFNQAVMEGIYTNRQVAIPVLFESLRYEKVKEEIRAFLQMEPVHKYSTDLSDRAFIDFLYERIRDTRQFG